MGSVCVYVSPVVGLIEAIAMMKVIILPTQMTEKPQLDRFGIAAALQEIAQMMELKGGQYRFAAKLTTPAWRFKASRISID